MKRIIKIYNQSIGPNYMQVPTILLKGQWLRKAGFESGEYVEVQVDGDFSIPTEILLDAIETCESTPEEFFWEDISKYKEQKELITAYDKLSNESKETIKNLIKNMK